jgi:hypothetical protein
MPPASPPQSPPQAPPQSPPQSPPSSPPAAPLPPPVAAVPAGSASNWSDPALWGGRLPDATAAVVIPAGKTVTLDTDATVRNLVVEGVLLFAERDLKLEANWIAVRGSGRLQAGTRDRPRQARLELVLSEGDRSEDALGMGTKFFGAMGGVIELHGAPRTRWTQLDATAAPGAAQITVLDAAGWRVGDRIAIAPSDYEPMEREVRGITAINGRTLTLDRPLQYQHWGRVQALGATGASLDQRAPVALLSSNITIRGATPADGRFGGHIMFMGNAVTQMSQIEVSAMGQRGRLARYPMHWHLTGDSPQSYLVDSAVHSSFQRGIVVHRANDLTIRNNVVFDTFGHMVFIESSNERRNLFERNLLMFTRPVPAADRNPEIAFEHEDPRVSGFWISNAHNRFIGNHVSGVYHGNGYWFVEGAHAPGGNQGRDADFYREFNLGPTDAYWRMRAASTFLEFRDNVASSIRNAAEFRETHFHGPGINGNGVLTEDMPYYAGTQPVLRNFKAFKVGMNAVWTQLPSQRLGIDGGLATNAGNVLPATALVIDNLVVADVRSAVFAGEFNGMVAMRGGVLWGNTDNQPPGAPVGRYLRPEFWKAMGNHNDDISQIILGTYSTPLRSSYGVTPQYLLSLRSNNQFPRFTEFSNVVMGQGWPY